jgi:leucyl aminopeptidase (aminopeptidase T)
MSTAWTENLLHTCMDLRAHERLLVLVDEPLRPAGEALSAAWTGAGGLIVLQASGLAAIPHRLVQEAQAADVVVALLSALDLGREPAQLRAAYSALRPEARWALGAFLTDEVLAQELTADYGEVARLTAATAARLDGVDRVHIRSAAGTDLTFRLGGRPVLQDTGLLTAPGARGNLPAGEAFVAPLEETGEGRLVVDGSLGDLLLDAPVTLTFQEGRVVAVEGGEAAAQLRRRLQAEPDAGMLGEFGIGTNPRARLRRRAMLDEKVLGTIHIALGGNQAFGGRNGAAAHYDCVVLEPIITLDGSPM